MRRIPALLLLAATAPALCASETHVLDEVYFDLADRYQGEAVFAVEKEGTPEDWKRVRFFLGEDILAMRSDRIEADGSQTLFDERYSDLSGSTTLYHSMSSAILDTRFKKTLTDAAESEISPISILRLIKHRRDEIGLHIIKRQSDATVTIGFSLTANGNTEEHEFDVLDRRIVEYRSTKRKGRFVNTIRYDRWQNLDNGQPIPTRILSTIATGDDRLIEHIRIESARAMPPDQTPKRPKIPAAYSVNDTTPQQRTAQPSPAPKQTSKAPQRPSSANLRRVSPILIGVGALLVLMAAIRLIIRARRA